MSRLSLKHISRPARIGALVGVAVPVIVAPFLAYAGFAIAHAAATWADSVSDDRVGLVVGIGTFTLWASLVFGVPAFCGAFLGVAVHRMKISEPGALTDSGMEEQHRHTLRCWAQFTGFCAILLFAFGLAATVLSMSLTRRFTGGVSLTVLVWFLMLVWLAGIGAWVRAVWLARDLPRSTNVLALAFQERPQSRLPLAVWWWARVSGRAMMTFVVALLGAAAVAALIDPWS